MSAEFSAAIKALIGGQEAAAEPRAA
jgi:hypothetical protein